MHDTFEDQPAKPDHECLFRAASQQGGYFTTRDALLRDRAATQTCARVVMPRSTASLTAATICSGDVPDSAESRDRVQRLVRQAIAGESEE